MAKLSSAVVWQGRSRLDNETPIVAIVTGITGASANPKTGPMAQLWILRADMPATVAVKNGGDAAICGDCKLRGTDGKERGCYVTVSHAPNNIYKTFKADKYLSLDPATVADLLTRNGVRLRLGAYGDPAALPVAVLDTLTRGVFAWTGYTHAWRTRPDLAPFVMASVDSPSEMADAIALGFRTFRTRAPEQALQPGEIICPASDEGNHRTTCERCTLCDGARPTDRRKHVAIIAHGSSTVHALKVIRRVAQ
jgi:hypothetical protein